MAENFLQPDTEANKPSTRLVFASYFILYVVIVLGVGESQMIAFEDFHWHLACFSCVKCNTLLEGEGFILEEEETYCEECAKRFLN